MALEAKLPGVVTVAVGLAATELGLVEVQTTLPPLLGLGTQLVPGTATVLPLAMFVQVMTVLPVRFDGFGLAVQTGFALAVVCVKATVAVEVLPAASREVAVGFDAMPDACPVQLMLVVPEAGLGVQVAPGIVLVVPASTVQAMVTTELPPAFDGLAVHTGAVGGVVSTV